ncbi:MAG: RNA methyltransferase [Oscillospiraceae bacterium]
MLNIIKSKDNPKIKHAVKLSKNPSERAEKGLFFASTPKVVTDIIKAGFEAESLFFMQGEYDRYETLLQDKDVFIITEEVSEKLCEDRTSQGVFGVFQMKKPEIKDIFSAQKLLILEDVQDPGNLGAIMRTALALGYENVVVSAKCADIYSPKVLRSGMTASVKLNVFKVQDIPQLVADLNANGVATVAACLDTESFLGQEKIPLPLAVIIGNEGSGITEKTLQAAKYKIKIPMSDSIESLNAAISAGIIMWQLRGE